jgi:glutamate-1-semialdehyde 2,1-aminomutase
MATATQVTDTDLARLDEIIEEETRAFLARQPKSRELSERAKKHLVSGVTSSWQFSNPQPIWIKEGRGSKVWDADGYEMVDLHGGFGAGVAGHAHPAIVEAVQRQVERGTHFGQPVEDAIDVAENLAERWGLPLWRFGQSGTESTMDAVHLMRAISGRDKIIKVAGSYHGHHDSVQVDVYNSAEELGNIKHPNSVAGEGGIPDAIVQLTRCVPYNDLDALERVLQENEGEVAGMILEPIMMNIGIIRPEPGYLEGVRELTKKYGVYLTFDEVKTGFTVAPGGATEYFGIKPDIVCVAKALGGGTVVSGIGGTDETMGQIDTGVYEQCGTFNGNPLAMAAARAAVTQVLTDDAYAHATKLREIMVTGCEAVIEEYELPAYVEAIGFKGCVVFSPKRIRNYWDFLEWDDRFSHAHWFFQNKGGVFLVPWGKIEQWTFSVQHSEDDVQRFVDNFATFAKALRS